MLSWTEADKRVLPIALLVIIILTLVVYIIFRKKSDKIKNIPLIIITISMLVMEVAKQTISIRQGYDLWHVPLHFCSLFIYWFPLMTFFKDGKIKRFGTTMSFAAAMSVFVCFYLSPGDILGPNNTANVFENFFSVHTFVYHHLIFLYLFVGLSLNMFKLNKNCFIHVVIGISMYGAAALFFAYRLNTNYCNLLTSQIDFVEGWRQSLGQIPYTIGVYLFGIAIGCLVCCIKLFIQKSTRKQVQIII